MSPEKAPEQKPSSAKNIVTRQIMAGGIIYTVPALDLHRAAGRTDAVVDTRPEKAS